MSFIINDISIFNCLLCVLRLFFAIYCERHLWFWCHRPTEALSRNLKTIPVPHFSLHIPLFITFSYRLQQITKKMSVSNRILLYIFFSFWGFLKTWLPFLLFGTGIVLLVILIWTKLKVREKCFLKVKSTL